MTHIRAKIGYVPKSVGTGGGSPDVSNPGGRRWSFRGLGTVQVDRKAAYLCEVNSVRMVGMSTCLQRARVYQFISEMEKLDPDRSADIPTV
jgi:hypothetical protein